LLALQAITGAPVRGFAYPFGNYSPRVIEVLRPLGLAYARTCDNARDIFPCAEPLAWPTTCYQNATDENSKSVWLDEFRRRYDSGDSFCFHVWGHSCEFGDDWSRAREWFQTLAGFENIWSCTNLELWDSAIIGQEQQK
jgi:peptidoglycan/xylan/chitin deacetylase (PgdA/CDA1 family)